MYWDIENWTKEVIYLEQDWPNNRNIANMRLRFLCA